MKILIGEQIKQADAETIKNEPVEPIALMERAAEAVAVEMCNLVGPDERLLFFIGKGNNGGDGLAVARIMSNAGFQCAVYMPWDESDLSEDCLFNWKRLPEKVDIVKNTADAFDPCDTIIVDAVLGSGAKGEVTGRAKEMIGEINGSGCSVFSIDLPSGMKTEFDNDPSGIVRADYTFAIETPKLAMLLPEAGNCTGKVVTVPIGLDERFIGQADSTYNYVTEAEIKGLLKPRSRFSHKGTYGHALLVCGSNGMAGAAILAANGAVRSGCGLVTVHLPESVSTALFASVPCVIASVDTSSKFTSLPQKLDEFTVCGLGCGLGEDRETVTAFERLLRAFGKPMVIDADALNILAHNPELRKLIPENSILTPHPGELKRMVGEWKDDREKIGLVRQLAAETRSIILLKGANTMICMPDGSIFFNSTGTPGMAKGGSGDVLTGFLTGLIARGYAPSEAARIGVYLHGRAGEKCADYYGVEAMNGSDLADFIPEAFMEICEK